MILLLNNGMHKHKLDGKRIRAFFPGKKAAKKPVGDAAWTQQQTICVCNLNGAKRASGHKKSLKITEKQACLFYRKFSGFSLCALRTAGPASLVCPEAVGNTSVSACVCCFYGVKRRFSASLLTQKRSVSLSLQFPFADLLHSMKSWEYFLCNFSGSIV